MWLLNCRKKYRAVESLGVTRWTDMAPSTEHSDRSPPWKTFSVVIRFKLLQLHVALTCRAELVVLPNVFCFELQMQANLPFLIKTPKQTGHKLLSLSFSALTCKPYIYKFHLSASDGLGTESINSVLRWMRSSWTAGFSRTLWSSESRKGEKITYKPLK